MSGYHPNARKTGSHRGPVAVPPGPEVRVALRKGAEGFFDCFTPTRATAARDGDPDCASRRKSGSRFPEENRREASLSNDNEKACGSKM